MLTPIEAQQVANSVLEVLAGVPLQQAAAQGRMEPDVLADAVAVYRTAGQAALEAQAEAAVGWYSVSIQFADWSRAEQTAATLLGPRLQQAEDAGVLAEWWFIRKYPCWRLRCTPAPTATRSDAKDAVDAILDGLHADGPVDRWWETVYEPEALAFGGPQGMAIAHALFHSDSRGVLDYVRRHSSAEQAGPILGHRELSVLLCSTFFFGAGQEPHEQGDIWDRVAQLRPLSTDTPAARLSEVTRALHLLMNVDTSSNSALFDAGSALSFIAPWAAAFETAGQHLGDAAQDGTLQRGIRDILAHHVIFAWNRIGLDGRTQSILARAARDTLMNPADAPTTVAVTDVHDS